MTWGSLVLLDIAEPSRTVPRGTSEQYLFCRIVSACLKLRDTWWRSEFFLAKYFLRFLNRCQKARRVRSNQIRSSAEVRADPTVEPKLTKMDGLMYPPVPTRLGGG
ncbi:hypothetical protein HPB51_003445 [Rhipicephalus microplus]|uniref:Uncharacterized protein n=1 Tax=Rhipicephalus microplus TaxID=6941 RepID=A0A9J6EXA5_RHIMP|nr:hypothetical protein HPB51_003445 [Rhipicephalus microplus]